MKTLGTFSDDTFLAGENPHVVTNSGVMLKNVGLVKRCTLLGRILHGAVPSTGTAVGTVNQTTVTTVSAGKKTKAGIYTLKVVESASGVVKVQVINPLGDLVGVGYIGANVTDELNFTIVDGGTEAAVGSSFTVTVPEGTDFHKLKPLDSEATDGSAEPYAILMSDIDATDDNNDVDACPIWIGGCFDRAMVILVNEDDEVATYEPRLRELGIVLKSVEQM